MSYFPAKGHLALVALSHQPLWPFYSLQNAIYSGDKPAYPALLDLCALCRTMTGVQL